MGELDKIWKVITKTKKLNVEKNSGVSDTRLQEINNEKKSILNKLCGE